MNKYLILISTWHYIIITTCIYSVQFKVPTSPPPPKVVQGLISSIKRRGARLLRVERRSAGGACGVV